MDILHTIGIIAVAALCTGFIRAVPFLIFGGNKKVPHIIHYLGDYLPAAIMVTLVIYCLRNITPVTGNYGLPELISVVVVIGLHLWKKNILLTVGAGTVCYMLLIQAVFV